MTFKLGTATRQHLEGVDPRLVDIFEKGILVSPIDFGVPAGCGVRTAEYQHSLYLKGRGGPGSGRIVTQKDGYKNPSNHQIREGEEFGRATDVVPWVQGVFTWNWAYIYPMMAALHPIVKASKLPIVWGGVWDRKFADLDPKNLEDEVQKYCDRHKGPDFPDGVHLELV